MMKRSHDAAVSIFGNLGIFILESGGEGEGESHGKFPQTFDTFFVPLKTLKTLKIADTRFEHCLQLNDAESFERNRGGGGGRGGGEAASRKRHLILLWQTSRKA